MSKIRLDIEIEATDIESVVYLNDYILELTFADEKVKQIDFALMMQEMANGKFLDMEQFKSYTFDKEILYWGKREIMFYCESLYEYKPSRKKMGYNLILDRRRRFSKLKSRIDSLFDPVLKMEFCCYAFPMRGGWAENSIPRFCVKLDKEIIWDYPKDFDIKYEPYGVWAGHNGISNIVQEYIETPIVELLDKKFEGEDWSYYGGYNETYNLTDLFKAADRRIGKKKLVEWSVKAKNYTAYKIISIRLYGLESIIK